MSLKYFYDALSQPSRSLYIFLKINKIPFEPRIVNIGRGEHLTEEFKANYNPLQKLPFIHDGNFKLSESIAIIRYLTRKYNLNSNWYPIDSIKQARVDEYLEWQHLNIRLHCSAYFLKKFVGPLKTGKEPNPKTVQILENNMSDCLNKFEQVWLNNKRFVCGDEISIADVFAACEIEQPRMAGYEPREGRPVLKDWLDRVRQETNPVYDEIHKFLNKIASVALEKDDNKQSSKL